MVVLPVAKLGTLALKTFSRPIGNRLKKEAGYHPKFRNFIINLAQANHRLTARVQSRIYGNTTYVAIPPLDEEKAVQAAADIFGEVFVFMVAGAAVILEVHRSARSKARQEELRRQELQAIKTRNEELAREQKTRIEELAREVELLGFEQKTRIEELAREQKTRNEELAREQKTRNEELAREQKTRNEELAREQKTRIEELAREVELLGFEQKERNEEFAREVELLGQKFEQLEQLVRGFAVILSFRYTHASEDRKSKSN